MENNTDLCYAKCALLETLDKLAIDDVLRVQLMLYLNSSFESEEILADNIRVLQERHIERQQEKVLRKEYTYGNESIRHR